MKKIRIGNDITVSWTITNKDGSPYSLKDRDLMLLYSTIRGPKKASDFSVASNVLTWTFPGKDQKELGSYTLTLVENNQEAGMLTIDYCEAFALVRRSCMTGGNDDDGIAVETVELSTTVDVLQIQPVIPEIGDNGNWYINGIDTGKSSLGKAFTFEDFTPEQILFLQKPALDAAESLGALEYNVQRNEQARVLAEENRARAETSRSAAEEQRANEFSQIKQETKTVLNEANSAKNLADQAITNANKAQEKVEQALTSIQEANVVNSEVITNITDIL